MSDIFSAPAVFICARHPITRPSWDPIIRNNATFTFEPRYLCRLDITEFQPHAVTGSVLRDENCSKLFERELCCFDLVAFEGPGNILETLNSAEVDPGTSGEHGA
ncbi:hypothetical protein ASC80_05640 [Afipia sp. Root123D2]|nr:hypothetical protein ASC80_05640 [Afipia sp. Root123D2]